MKIKRMLEFTNYSDDVVNNLPKELRDNGDVEPSLNITMKPEIAYLFKHIIELSIDGNDDEIEEILMDTNDLDRKILLDNLDNVHNYISKRIKYVSTFN
jgi:hypothetical protein